MLKCGYVAAKARNQFVESEKEPAEHAGAQ
jgi:hypothetical protein